jgi:L-fuculose-phosphate aldolase
MNREELKLRDAIIANCRWMNASGLNQGRSGNISARHEDRILMTPSATPYDAMVPDMIALTAAPRRTAKRLSRAR